MAEGPECFQTENILDSGAPILFLRGGGVAEARAETHLPPNFSPSDFCHFILKMGEKAIMEKHKKRLEFALVGRTPGPPPGCAPGIGHHSGRCTQFMNVLKNNYTQQFCFHTKRLKKSCPQLSSPHPTAVSLCLDSNHDPPPIHRSDGAITRCELVLRSGLELTYLAGAPNSATSLIPRSPSVPVRDTGEQRSGSGIIPASSLVRVRRAQQDGRCV